MPTRPLVLVFFPLALLAGPLAAAAQACVVELTWETPTCAQVNVHVWEPPPGVRVCV